MELDQAANQLPLQFAEKVKSAAQEPPATGVVSKVVEGEDCYHFIYKSSSTKGNTINSGDSSNDAACNGSMQDEQPREFKLVKRDLYLERQQKEPKSAPDYTELQQVMNLQLDQNRPNSIVHSLLEKILSNQQAQN